MDSTSYLSSSSYLGDVVIDINFKLGIASTPIADSKIF